MAKEKAAPVERNTAMVPVVLSREAWQKFEGQNLEETFYRIGEAATSLLSDAAGGGVMMSPAEAQKMREFGVAEPAELIRLLERARGRDNGRTVIRVPVDPLHERGLEAIGVTRGRTVGQLVQDAISQMIAQGMLFNGMAPPHRILNLDVRDAEDLQDMMGDAELTGTDLVRKMRELMIEADPLLAA